MVAQQAISATGKVSLQEDDSGATFIMLELPFYRAWAAVGRALPESGFVEMIAIAASDFTLYISGRQPRKKMPVGSAGCLAAQRMNTPT